MLYKAWQMKHITKLCEFNAKYHLVLLYQPQQYSNIFQVLSGLFYCCQKKSFSFKLTPCKS